MKTTPTGGAGLENMGLSPITRKCKGPGRTPAGSSHPPEPHGMRSPDA